MERAAMNPYYAVILSLPWRFAMRQALSLLAVLAFASPAIAQDKDPPRMVSVSGEARVFAAPDRAHVSAGVASEAKTAAEALSANSAEMRKVIDAIKAEGVEARDIQTSNISVSPVYTNPKEGERPRIDGYRASNDVSVTIRDLTKIGDILDSVVTLGATNVGDISFSVSDADRRLDEARAEAVQDAMRKARLLAEAAGAELGEILSLSENAYAPTPRPYLARAAAMEASAAPPIETGEQTLSVRVSASWRLE
jgi:uncharacterized protein YggE